jgi:hypothetical protein
MHLIPKRRDMGARDNPMIIILRKQAFATCLEAATSNEKICKGIATQ